MRASGVILGRRLCENCDKLKQTEKCTRSRMKVLRTLPDKANTLSRSANSTISFNNCISSDEFPLPVRVRYVERKEFIIIIYYYCK